MMICGSYIKNEGLTQVIKEQETSVNLYIKSEIHTVAILNDVLFSFKAP